MTKFFITTLGVVFLGAFTYILYPSPVQAQIVINELLPNPDTPSDQTEWVELYNAGEQTVDVQGWRLNNWEVSAASLRIPANEYLLLVKDIEFFIQEYADVEVPKAEVNLALTNSGRELILYNLQGAEVDRINYGNSGTNQHWSRTGPDCNMFESMNLHSIGKVNNNIDLGCFGQSEYMQIEFSNSIGVWSRELFASLSDSVNIRFPNPNRVHFFTNMKGEPLEFPLTGESYLGFVYLHIQDVNDQGVYRSGVLKIMPDIRLNEVFVDPVGPDTGLEWVELLVLDNIDLFDLKLKVDAEEVNFTTSQQEQYLLLRLEGEAIPNCSQPSDCESVIQVTYQGVMVDELVVSDSSPGFSLALDEDVNWQYGWQPTPKAENQPYQAYRKIQISEIYASPSSGDSEWLELYNFGERDIELSNWQLKDASGVHVVSNGVIKAGKHLVIRDLAISLNNSGDEIALINDVGILIDELVYAQMSSEQSHGLRFAGAKYLGTFNQTRVPTPGTRNKFEAQVTSSGSGEMATEEQNITDAGDGGVLAIELTKYLKPRSMYQLDEYLDNVERQIIFATNLNLIFKMLIIVSLALVSLHDLIIRIYPYLKRALSWWLQLG